MCKVTNCFYFGMDDKVTRVLQYNQNQDKDIDTQELMGNFWPADLKAQSAPFLSNSKQFIVSIWQAMHFNKTKMFDKALDEITFIKRGLMNKAKKVE